MARKTDAIAAPKRRRLTGANHIQSDLAKSSLHTTARHRIASNVPSFHRLFAARPPESPKHNVTDDDVNDEIDDLSDSDDRGHRGRGTHGLHDRDSQSLGHGDTLYGDETRHHNESIPSKTGTSDLWLDLFPPRTASELAVNKAKYEYIRGWLGAFAQQRASDRLGSRLLVVYGPPGAGKSTAIRVAAHELNIGLDVWDEADIDSSYAAGTPYESLVNKFSRFLHISESYGALQLASDVNSLENSPSCLPPLSGAVVLLDELPSYVFASGRDGARIFAEQLLSAIESNGKPIILVVSESSAAGDSQGLVDTSTERTGHVEVRTLLTSKILEHAMVASVYIPAVARTKMTMALNGVLDKFMTGQEEPLPKRKRSSRTMKNEQFDKSFVRDIVEASHGDLRAAINSLQFLWLTRGLPQASGLGAIGLRQVHIGLSHSVGKVVYNKRETQDEPDGRHSIASRQDVDSVLDNSGVDIGTFVSALHENFGPSTANVEQYAECCDALCDSDIFLAKSSQAGSQDSALEQIAGQLAVRGLLEHLPGNAKRPKTANLMRYPSQHWAGFRQREQLRKLAGTLKQFAQRYGALSCAVTDGLLWLFPYAAKIMPAMLPHYVCRLVCLCADDEASHDTPTSSAHVDIVPAPSSPPEEGLDDFDEIEEIE